MSVLVYLIQSITCHRALIAIVSVASFFGRRSQCDHVVDAKNGDGGLGGEFETLDLGDGRLQNSRLLVVADDALEEIQADPLQVGVFRFDLWGQRTGSSSNDDASS